MQVMKNYYYRHLIFALTIKLSSLNLPTKKKKKMVYTSKPHWDVLVFRIRNNYILTHTQRKHTPWDMTDETKWWNDRWTVKTTHTLTPPFIQPSGSIGGPCWCFLPAHLSATKWLVDWWLMGNGPAACWGMSRWQPDLPSCFDYVSSLQSGVLGAVLLTSTIELQNKDRQHRFFTMLCIIRGVEWQLATCSLLITVLYVPCLENFLKHLNIGQIGLLCGWLY